MNFEHIMTMKIFWSEGNMHIVSFSPFGYEGNIVSVEVDLRRGIPAVDLVGLADNAVKEARERMRSAIINSGFEFWIPMTCQGW